MVKHFLSVRPGTGRRDRPILVALQLRQSGGRDTLTGVGKASVDIDKRRAGADPTSAALAQTAQPPVMTVPDVIAALTVLRDIFPIDNNDHHPYQSLPTVSPLPQSHAPIPTGWDSSVTRLVQVDERLVRSEIPLRHADAQAAGYYDGLAWLNISAVRRQISSDIDQLVKGLAAIEKMPRGSKKIQYQLALEDRASYLLGDALARVKDLTDYFNKMAEGMDQRTKSLTATAAATPQSGGHFGPNDIRVDGRPLEPKEVALLNRSPFMLELLSDVGSKVTFFNNSKADNEPSGGANTVGCGNHGVVSTCVTALDPRDKTAAQKFVTLAHELGHVKYPDKGDVYKDNRDEYIANRAYGEGCAVMTQLVAYHKLGEGGTEVRAALVKRLGGTESEMRKYESIYDDYSHNRITFEEAAKRAATQYTDGVPSGSRVSYKFIYGDTWDMVHGYGK